MALPSSAILGKTVLSEPQLASPANWGHPCTSSEGLCEDQRRNIPDMISLVTAPKFEWYQTVVLGGLSLSIISEPPYLHWCTI